LAVEPKESPSVGVDEWVARSGERKEYLPGWRGDVQRRVERVGWWPRLAVATAIGLFIPLVIGLNSFQFQVGIDALLLAILALGLNVSVGWAGLLDLGYVAFYGFGAYGYALLSSNQLNPPAGIHWPAYFSIPLVMIGAGILGLLVGLPSRRLIGDYLAIVTLFFGEAFFEFTNNVAPSKLGGPNGIIALDPIHGFHGQITTLQGYFILLVILLVLSIAVLHMLDTSRTGRAWRAVREDPLAASAMTVPVNRVKLMAFAIGAMIAAMAGTVFAAQQSNVFPSNFDTPYLIMIYAGLILGGAGSISGAVLGGLLVSLVVDGFLRSPTQSGYIFYGVILITLLVKLRPWSRLAFVIGGTIVFGFVMNAIVGAIWPSATAGIPGANNTWTDLHWAIVPANPVLFGNICFVALLCMVVVLAQVHHRWRTILLIPTLYLAACTWEARLSQVPAITRLLLLGAILIVVMAWRPSGLLGSRRVEIV
jgi:branched-chain amino acid transport system permease protein